MPRKLRHFYQVTELKIQDSRKQEDALFLSATTNMGVYDLVPIALAPTAFRGLTTSTEMALSGLILESRAYLQGVQKG